MVPAGGKSENSSTGAASNQETPSMPLLAELVPCILTVAIKISLLRSCCVAVRSQPILGRSGPPAGCIRIAQHERHFVLRPDPPLAVYDILHTQPDSENRSTRSRNQFDQRTWWAENNRSIYPHNVLSVSASSWRIPQNQEIGSGLSCSECKG